MSEHNSQCYRYTWNFTTGVFGAVMQCELLLTQTSYKMDKQHNTIKNNRNTTPNNITPHHAKKHCTLVLTVKFFFKSNKSYCCATPHSDINVMKVVTLWKKN